MKTRNFVGGAIVLMAMAGLALTPERVTIKREKIANFVLQTLDRQEREGEDKPVSILVMLKEQADLSRVNTDPSQSHGDRVRKVYDLLRMQALSTQDPLVAFLDSKGVQYKRFYIANMIGIEQATPELIQELSLRADVGHIHGNPKVALEQPKLSEEEFAFAIQSFLDGEEGLGPETSLVATKATEVWSKYKNRGEGIVIAGQDTGIQWDHPALKNQYRGFNKQTQAVDHSFSWHDAIHKPATEGKNKCGYDLAVPCDDHGHGTHTIGTIVGDDGAGNQIGMAPGAQWIGCRNMDEGNGTPARYIECFEWFLAPYAPGTDPMKDGRPEMAPHVINNSWGCPSSEGCTGSEFVPVLQALYKAGVMVVVSAGNSGSGCSTIMDPPAWHSSTTLSVGAMNHRTGAIASFSSRGPSKIDGGIGPDVTAPGVSIRSSVPGNKYEGGMWSGTSMAGPHVVGQIALLWAVRPELVGKIDETTRIVTTSSTPKTSTQTCGDVPGTAIPNNTFGYGAIDALAAIEKK